MKFQGSRLLLDTGGVELEKPIESAIEFESKIIVLFQYDSYDDDDPDGQRNVVAVDKAGITLWRIQETPEAITDADGNREWNAYVALGLEKGTLLAYDWGGLCWKVNHKTGEVFDAIFTR